MVTQLLEEYRPAWEIEPGWQIRTEDGRWLRVTTWFEYKSSDLGKGDVIVLHLEDISECRVWADALIMTRLQPQGAT